MKTHDGRRMTTTPNDLGPVWITKHDYRIPYQPEPIADPDLPTLAG